MTQSPELSDTKRALLAKYLTADTPLPTARVGIREPGADMTVSSPQAGSPVDVVTVQPHGSQPPLFYLHVHWIGGAFYTFRLAQELGPNQPFYVINTYRFDGLPVPPSMEEIASACIEGIRAVRPTGPYRLAGFCGGGLIAYEMAQQLRAQGHEVDNLILIDPNAGPIRSIRLTGRAIRVLGAGLRLRPEQQVDWFLRTRYIWRVLRRARDENTAYVDGLLQEWRTRQPHRALLPSAGALRQDWMNLFIWSVSAYRPRKFMGKVTYLFAGENPHVRRVWWGKSDENDMARIYLIAGTHETCRNEHLPVMAQAIRASWAREGQT